MNPTEKLSLIIKELGNHWGLDGLVYQANEPTLLVFNDEFVVNLTQSHDLQYLVVYVNLGTPYHETEDMANKLLKVEKLLQLNGALKDKYFGSLAMNTSKAVIYSYQISIETLTSQVLENALDKFIDQAKQLKQDILAPKEEKPAYNLGEAAFDDAMVRV
ncbi:MAG: type III secretion system chaperone [Pseudomonadota bacterium]